MRTLSEGELVKTLSDLGAAKTSLMLDPNTTPHFFGEIFSSAGGALVEHRDPCVLPRAIKNQQEIDGARKAHLRDGVAVTKFLHWLDTTAQTATVDEIEAATKLEGFRAEDAELVDLSFDTISGAGPNGAVVHYRVDTSTNIPFPNNNLYLVDSGAQYKDGTTDITRTVPIGTPTAEMVDRFTKVLKGHIAIASVRFPANTTGATLDILARHALWQAGLDYDHGTGHGVGSFLSVHEGPQGIAKGYSAQALKPGMIISNEPGYYKTGAFGIRIENLVLVSEMSEIDGGERPMHSLETLTLAPIHLSLIDKDQLSDSERKWLNAYHKRVFDQLAPRLPAGLQNWFKKATRPI